MKISIKVKGNRKTARYIKTVTTKLQRSAVSGNKEVANKIASKARIKAPVDMGALKRSIQVIGARNTHYVIAGEGLPRPYAIAQERSFAPHWIHTSMIDQKVRRKYQDALGLDRFIFVRRFTPFMEPALRETMREYGHIMKKHISTAMKRRK